MEQEPAPGLLPQFLEWTSRGFGVALWVGAAALMVLWLLMRIVRLDHRLHRDGSVVQTLPELALLARYAVAAIFLLYVAFALAGSFVDSTVWSWVGKYSGQLASGLWVTLQMLVLSLVIGFIFAVPVGLVQVTGPRPLAWLARGYCTVIRGTPLLIQLWLLYYGLGSVFQDFPEIRQSFLWPILREGYFYGVLSLTLSVIGYEGEIMRGALLGVPKGEIEAARAFGMSPWTLLRRVWLPRAVRTVLPTLGGEAIGQLKSTPVVSTVTVYDLFGVTTKVTQETYRVYEPLLLAALTYFILVYIIARIVAYVEAQVPQKR